MMGAKTIESIVHLSRIVLDSDSSKFYISLIENEASFHLGNPRFNYHVSVKNSSTQEEIACYNLLNGVEKKKEHGLDDGGAMKRRIDAIKDAMPRHPKKSDVLELFFDKDYIVGAKYNNYLARKEEGFSLSYKDQAAIVSGIMHVASGIEKGVDGKITGKKVVKLGNHKSTEQLKDKLLREVPPETYFIPRALEDL
jgi:hypothetical protein